MAELSSLTAALVDGVGVDTFQGLEVLTDTPRKWRSSRLAAMDITGDFIGSAATFAALPTTSSGGKTAINGDWVALTESDGVNEPGLYLYDGASYSYSAPLDFTASGVLARFDRADADYGTPLLWSSDELTKWHGWETVADTVEMQPNRRYQFNAAQTNPLPTAPVAGDWVRVSNDSPIREGTRNTITGTIRRLDQNATVPGYEMAPGLSVLFVWDGAAWIPQANGEMQISLDATDTGLLLRGGTSYEVDAKAPGSTYRLPAFPLGTIRIRVANGATDPFDIAVDGGANIFRFEDNTVNNTFTVEPTRNGQEIVLAGDLNATRWHVYRPWLVEMPVHYPGSGGDLIADKINSVFSDDTVGAFPPAEGGHEIAVKVIQSTRAAFDLLLPAAKEAVKGRVTHYSAMVDEGGDVTWQETESAESGTGIPIYAAGLDVTTEAERFYTIRIPNDWAGDEAKGASWMIRYTGSLSFTTVGNATNKAEVDALLAADWELVGPESDPITSRIFVVLPTGNPGFGSTLTEDMIPWTYIVNSTIDRPLTSDQIFLDYETGDLVNTGLTTYTLKAGEVYDVWKAGAFTAIKRRGGVTPKLWQHSTDGMNAANGDKIIVSPNHTINLPSTTDLEEVLFAPSTGKWSDIQAGTGGFSPDAAWTFGAGQTLPFGSDLLRAIAVAGSTNWLLLTGGEDAPSQDERYETVALLPLATTVSSGARAVVFSDPVDANNRSYIARGPAGGNALAWQ